MFNIGLDWVSFTFYTSIELKSVLKMFSDVDVSLFDAGHGRMGYKSMKLNDTEGIYVLYDGNSDMGIHLDFHGAAGVSCFLRVFKFYFSEVNPFDNSDTLQVDEFYNDNMHIISILSKLLDMGNFTRLDICCDDKHDSDNGQAYYTPLELDEYDDAGRIVSRTKKRRLVKEKSGDDRSYTFYMGSRNSALYLRVYDKGMEQKVCFPWVRWEFEIKTHDTIKNCISSMVTYGSLNEFFNALLNSFMRIIDLDDSNRSRCSSNEKWMDFVKTVNKAKISVPKVIPSLDEYVSKVLAWVNKQVAPSLRRVVLASAGDLTFLYDMIDLHKCSFDDFKKYSSAYSSYCA